MSCRKTILIVEDHPLFAHAVGEIVSRLDPAAQIRSAHTLSDALAAIERGGAPDFVLLDVHLPDVSGLEGVRVLRGRLPDVPIVVLSAVEDPALLKELQQAGIDRFVPKRARPADIIEAIRQVYMETAGAAVCETESQPAEYGAARAALSQRQLEVLREMATGKSNKEIARSLDISVDTVRAHVVEILARLDVRNRTEAVRVLFSDGYGLSK